MFQHFKELNQLHWGTNVINKFPLEKCTIDDFFYFSFPIDLNASLESPFISNHWFNEGQNSHFRVMIKTCDGL